MNNSSPRIFLPLILISSLILVSFILDDVYGNEGEITSKSIAYENTSIIEFTNNGLEEIETIRIWLEDSSFISFKPQNGWVSPMASIDTITFTTLESLKINEVVKFGVITERPTSEILWEALNQEGNLIETGTTYTQNMPSFLTISEQKLNEHLTTVFFNSTFKVIPKNLHPGSTIRVNGDGFIPNSNLTLFLGDTSPVPLVTDENGYFMLTMKISENQKTEQINFILRDKHDNEKIISLYVTEIEQEISNIIDFTGSEIQNEFYRSDSVEFSGTSNPDSPVLITIKDSQDNLFSTEIINTDSKGDWSALVYVLPTIPLGTYTAEITDGENTIIKSWDVVMSKQLHILPTKLTFKSNELIKFNGTAIPNERINIKLVNPQGNAVLSKNFIVNPSGFFEIEYETLPSSLKGTYALYAFQKFETEIIFVGLDASPKKILSIQLNNVNYRNNDVAIIGITGENSQDITLLILDDNDHEKFNDKIKLGPDGKRTYPLNLTTFPTGVYTVLVSMAGSQKSDIFTVDLQSSHRPIEFDMIKNIYNQGESITVMGKSQPDTKVNLFLIDPDGIIINQQETFVDETGSLFTTSFLIPYDELFGKWVVRSESGLNSDNFEFQVISLGNEGLSVSVIDIIYLSFGKLVTIEGFVTGEQIVSISINDPNGNSIFQTNIETTETGEFDLLWNAPSESVSGTYSVIVTDSFEKITNTVFEFE